MTATNVNVFLFPNQGDSNPDSVDYELGIFDVLDIGTGTFLGWAGVKIPSDPKFGYDAVYGWEASELEHSTDPYKTLSDAADALANFVSANGES